METAMRKTSCAVLGPPLATLSQDNWAYQPSQTHPTKPETRTNVHNISKGSVVIVDGVVAAPGLVSSHSHARVQSKPPIHGRTDGDNASK